MEVYFHGLGGGIFLQRRLTSTAEVYFYSEGIFLRRRCISKKQSAYYLYGKEEPMHGADEFHVETALF